MKPIIRLATEKDTGAVLDIYTPIVQNSVISFEMQPPDQAEMCKRLNNTLKSLPWLVCENQGEILGYVYASKHRSREAYQWSLDVSAYVNRNARRRGIAKALYVSLFKILALQGYFNVYAGIALPNPASVGLHEALGFRPVGIYEKVGYKLDAWHDVGWWQLALQERIDEPHKPLSLKDVKKSPWFEAAVKAGLDVLKTQGM